MRDLQPARLFSRPPARKVYHRLERLPSKVLAKVLAAVGSCFFFFCWLFQVEFSIIHERTFRLLRSKLKTQLKLPNL